MSAEKSLTRLMATCRRERGWSQEHLAAQAKISRAAVSAIENGAVVPSVRVALALAHVFGLTVEELFGPTLPAAGGESWSIDPTGPVAGYWEVEDAGATRRYPAESLMMNPCRLDGALIGGRWQRATRDRPPPTLVLACCDPAARWLGAEYERASGVRLLVLPRNGLEALKLLQRGAVHVGGIHTSTEEDPEANRRRVREVLGPGWVLLRMTDWLSGIALPAGEKHRSASSLARGHRRWAMREKGAAARDSLDRLLGAKRPAGRVVRSHLAVADAVMAGWANAGITLQLCAAEDHLEFIPLRREGLDLVFAERLLEDRRIRQLISLLQSRAFRQVVATLPGYSSGQTGSLVTS
jgi:molybdate-binding protein/DNA-binding XRE family transcriptional regulator